MKKKSLNTLKDYAKHRFLTDTIEVIRSKIEGLCVLVLDPHSVKVISSICKMHDLIASKVSAIEQLMLGRKRFPDYNAIYILKPVKESVQQVMNDFKDLNSPQYAFVHLCFLSPLPTDLLKLLGTSRELVPRIKTLKELNLDYLIEEPEIFTFSNKPSLSAFVEDEVSVYARRLMTVCNTFMENPYVQYDKKSKICKGLAIELQNRMEDFIKKAGKDLQIKTPRGTVIILDRSFDLSAPIMHEYCYEVILHDLLFISKEGAINTKSLTKPWDKEEKKENILLLGQNDPLWNNYRYLHIGEVFKLIANGMKEVAKSNEQMGDNSDLDKLQEVMAEMPNYKEVVASYQLHGKLTTETSKLYSNMNHTELIRLEQEIITSVDEKGKEIDPKAIASTISKLSEFFPNLSEENKLRIYLLYLANYEVPKKDAKQLEDKFTNEKYKKILRKVELLGYKTSDTSHPRRRTPKIDTIDFEAFKQRMEQSQMASTMYIPKVAKVAMEASRKSLPLSEFPFIGDAPKDYVMKKEVKTSGTSIKKGVLTTSLYNSDKNSEEFWLQPRIIVFVVGGISYQELTMLFKMQQERKINCPLTVGSNCIIDPKAYISSFDTLSNDLKLK